ncbi:MAG: MATE family efflux transporter [Solirubrobacteraceae bacterium]
MSTQTDARLKRRVGRRLTLGEDDRRIVTLALPALGALAAEPLYVLVDTAIVGHLGVTPLAALALAGAVLSGIVSLCNFLAYGSTPMIGRLYAAGRADDAAHLGRQAITLASILGVVMAVAAFVGAEPAIALLGGEGKLARLGVLYMRIAALGLPFSLIAVAGQGYLRGLARLRAPFLFLLAGNLLNAVLEVVFVYGLHLGIAGSAWATVIAQVAIAIALLTTIAPLSIHDWLPDRRALRALGSSGGQIFVRTASLYGAFLLAGAVLAHVGAPSLAAHQIVFQLWMFLALALDALAIAAQVLISQELGGGETLRARQLAVRVLLWSTATGMLLVVVLFSVSDLVPHIFTANGAVLDRVAAIWPIFAIMQPFNAAVFALDGILIGAGDTRYLMWAMLASSVLAFCPLALASAALGWGIVGVWSAIVAFLLARLLTCGLRFRTERWAVIGATR